MNDDISFGELSPIDDRPLDILRDGRNGDKPRPPSNADKENLEFAEGSIKSAVEAGLEALSELATMAQAGEDPKSYAALARLIDSIASASDRLVRIRDQGGLKPRAGETPQMGVDRGAPQITNTGDVLVDKAVFVGSPAELQKLLDARNK